MRLALYGGTFDPIHHGHLILARDAMEQLQLDRVIFIPAAISPHKLGSAPADGEQRARMVAAAVAGEPGFEMDDLEMRRAGPSYAIQTVEAMRARWPGAHIFYLIGHDNVAKLGTWHQIGQLRGLVEFAVFGREAHDAPHAFSTVPRRIDISSSEVRARIARGASVRYLVPPSVLEIIERHRIYLPPAGQPEP